LTATGLLSAFANAVPKSVVRGIQFGLGLQLASLALRDYVPAAGASGYVLAGAAFVVTVLLLGNRKIPPAPLVIALGIVYALAFRLDGAQFSGAFGVHLPALHAPAWSDIVTGFFLLALPQIPLSLGNSILATKQVIADLFPERSISVRKIGFTYALMNLVNPFFGGVPTCHGSGGVAGHYAFGGRTGGSVVLYGAFYLLLGVFFSGGFHTVIELFPKPVLGVILLFEAVALMRLLRDMTSNAGDFAVVLLTGLIAFGVTYGYVVGLVVGWLLAALVKRNAVGLAR
ncbi:MAG TPA: molybdate transporter family protein, partial [Candidatus Nitrosotenuis sp.]|nr:molybdate transporter family protein [Candidatus Nitrosotenuis sp.]